MNTRIKAEASLLEFMNSKEKVVLITGTHQYQKHVLALQTLASQVNNSTVLFRGNSMKNFGTFFSNHQRNYKTGTAYSLGSNKLFLDSISITSWQRSPNRVDHGILYPVDSVCNSNGKERIITDICQRVSGKLFLVSWTDNTDYQWLSEIVERYVVYDVEEEDPEYHQRMLNIINR